MDRNDGDVEGLLAALAGPLSLRRRVLVVAAVLGGLVVAGVVGLLWLTEPGLPARTAVAFGGIVVVALGWVAYGTWVLTRRTPLLARDRVIAGWMGVGAAGLFAAAAVVLVGGPALPMALAVVGLAVLNLAVARSRRAALLRRKRELGG
jgi:hypothetical protein